MTTPDLTWIFGLDVVPTQTSAAAQFKSVILKVKKFLCGQDPVESDGAYTVIASSNGVTATAANHWTTDADIVSASSGARSWALLESPVDFPTTGKKIQILIDCGVGGNENVRLVFANSDFPFSTSGLLTTAAPIAPTNSIENSVFTHRQILSNASTLYPHRLHMWRNELGGFIIGFSQDGTGRVETVWSCLSATGGNTPDPWPVRCLPYRLTSLKGGFTREGIWSGPGSGIKAGWGVDGVPGGALAKFSYPKFSGSEDAYSTITGSGTDAGSKTPFIPLELYSNVAGKCFRRGRVLDLGFTAPGIDSNAIEGGADPIKQLVIGDLTLLTDAATLTL